MMTFLRPTRVILTTIAILLNFNSNAQIIFNTNWTKET